MSSSKIEDEALAKAYNRALELEKSGETEAAVAAYSEVLRLDPEDHGGAAVRLAALGEGETPEKAPDAYVMTLFDQHADVFEDVLVDELQYCVPLLMRGRLDALQLGTFDNVLDLGCGTGLVGVALADKAKEITGLDLSENMVELAYDKEVYDSLYVAEISDYLSQNDEGPFDLVVAADVLPYLGALDAFFSSVATNMKPGGYFTFSSETASEDEMEGDAYKVSPHHRFLHSEAYVRGALEKEGFEVVEMPVINVRFQEGKPSPGHLVMARLV